MYESISVLISGIAIGGSLAGIYFTRKLAAVEEDLQNHVYAAHQLAFQLGRSKRENEQLTEQAEAMLDNSESWKNS